MYKNKKGNLIFVKELRKIETERKKNTLNHSHVNFTVSDFLFCRFCFQNKKYYELIRKVTRVRVLFSLKQFRFPYIQKYHRVNKLKSN